MSPTKVKCPTCKRELNWEESRFRPFCSERCRLIDLGAWLSEQRSIPGDATPPDSDPDSAPSEPR